MMQAEPLTREPTANPSRPPRRLPPGGVVCAVTMRTPALPAALDARVRAALADWDRGGKTGRLWARDATLWTGADESRWLGWLEVADAQLRDAPRFRAVAEDVRAGSFTHVLLLGMGGSSLAPEVLARTFGRQPGYPALSVLDSTDPAQVRALEGAVDLARTLFVVSSKSGTTLEPNIFFRYFLARARERLGPDRAARHFVAITDPGSRLEAEARAAGFRAIHRGDPAIGGRYSALSDFGMVPAAAMGLDARRLLEGARDMAARCQPGVPAHDNPGVGLGLILGVLGREGRDKVTLVASPGLRDLGAWLEQLLAESTGKQGRGLIPVDREPLGEPAVYGADRLIVHLRLAAAPDPAQDRAVDALAAAGQPVVRLDIPEPYALGQEFFRWEMATAVAGAVLGINPFDQPDVEASKVATRELTAAYERTGALPAERPLAEGGGLTIFADEANASALRGLAGVDPGPDELVGAHLSRLRRGDYLALLAYLPMSEPHEAALTRIRQRARDARQVATCVGFGPRFLHSTGQAYKGGPPSGVFLQVTADPAPDLAIPEQRYTFGVVQAAQARGDYQVLAQRGRRALRVHLGPDVRSGLAALDRAVDRALGG